MPVSPLIAGRNDAARLIGLWRAGSPSRLPAFVRNLDLVHLGVDNLSPMWASSPLTFEAARRMNSSAFAARSDTCCAKRLMGFMGWLSCGSASLFLQKSVWEEACLSALMRSASARHVLPGAVGN